ncbi:uncharacterized protein LOC127880728 [Dreissena polymorpha]|uniref:Uncharacterized protein n=1 Tax=Dreissena polymorpha TaxID=45954 RepID=A0A9D4MQ36_DREPO|nr:uncharacterized protein LOC127880728 [Dreissena polymorpha]KAH3879919.1 hypothetical protein DPMN_003830 [Dreissena polymorpha]
MMKCVLFVALLGYLNTVCALSYNYFDEMAQNYCAAKGTGWTFSLRRDCGGVGPTCNDICTSATTEILTTTRNQQTKVACFDALYINKHHNKLVDNPTLSQPDAGKVSFATYGYGGSGCSWRPNHCGPNYCCCRAFS